MEINELIEFKLKDKNLVKIMNLHLWRYRYGIDVGDLKSIGLISLWKTLVSVGDSDKLIPFLCKRIKWECLRHIKQEMKHKRYTVPMKDLPDKQTYSFDDIVEGLAERDKNILYSRYMKGCTLKEIAAEQQCSIEYANILVHKAIDKLRNGV